MLSREESKQVKGMAVLAMIALHLFANDGSAYEPLLYFNGMPVMFFIGGAGGFCTAAYWLVSGYGSYCRWLSCDRKLSTYYKKTAKSVLRLLIDFWIILVLYSAIVVLCGHATDMLISPMVWLGNFVTIGVSYCGAWWFLPIYIIIAFIAPVLFFVVERINVKVIAPIALLLYVVLYLFRDNITIGAYSFDWLSGPVSSRVVLLGHAVPQFLIGTYTYRSRVFDRLHEMYMGTGESHVFKTFLMFLLGIMIIFALRFLPNNVLQPFYGFLFVALFIMYIRTEDFLKIGRIFSFFGYHSTNIWLIHMLFQNGIGGGSIYVIRYAIPLWIALVIISVLASYVVMGINGVVMKRLELAN